MADPIPLIAALADANVTAFQRMLRHGEGTSSDDGYAIMFGGERVTSFADHPRKRITKKLGSSTITSTAAGAYQFLAGTWDEMAKLYGLKDFSPKSQDIACVGLFIRRKALDDIIAGRFEEAVKKCNREWASLPGSPYGQPVVTIARAKQEYEKWGGKYAPQAFVPPAPAADPYLPSTATVAKPPVAEPAATPEVSPATTEDTAMAPFVAAVLPSLMSAIPELAKLFGSGSPTSERNIKAAEVVVGIAKDAIGARNEQELQEMITTDPAAATAVRAAVQEQWFKLTEVGGGVQAAREAAIKMQGDRSVWANPAMIISLVLLVFPMMLLLDVFFIHPDNYSSDGLRTQIVTGVMVVISMIGGFWLGTSFSSAKKDDTINKAMS